MNKEIEYVCDNCKKEFIASWSKDEAMKESKQLFGELPSDELDVLCDDCHKEFMDWHKSRNKTVIQKSHFNKAIKQTKEKKIYLDENDISITNISDIFPNDKERDNFFEELGMQVHLKSYLEGSIRMNCKIISCFKKKEVQDSIKKVFEIYFESVLSIMEKEDEERKK